MKFLTRLAAKATKLEQDHEERWRALWQKAFKRDGDLPDAEAAELAELHPKFDPGALEDFGAALAEHAAADKEAAALPDAIAEARTREVAYNQHEDATRQKLAAHDAARKKLEEQLQAERSQLWTAHNEADERVKALQEVKARRDRLADRLWRYLGRPSPETVAAQERARRDEELKLAAQICHVYRTSDQRQPPHPEGYQLISVEAVMKREASVAGLKIERLSCQSEADFAEIITDLDNMAAASRYQRPRYLRAKGKSYQMPRYEDRDLVLIDEASVEQAERGTLNPEEFTFCLLGGQTRAELDAMVAKLLEARVKYLRHNGRHGDAKDLIRARGLPNPYGDEAEPEMAGATPAKRSSDVPLNAPSAAFWRSERN